ncbi:hypothetical protein Poli38472_000645 [Pythium oligandrum]|uniref:PX domain-containing protein n=1 Tax=Pythium oligandrum TaxID=41045 RepID=A0A8K1CCQ2_PYTOL|nr:hypothetical protein Poli38472_000645 [Pythium oligandrum]|eukprot:TMW60603.1 hypothetical protein Poli38472_000645 [Pythium oligandrum]
MALDRFAYSRNGGNAGDEKCMIRVNIPQALKMQQHTRYQISVTNVQTRQTWHVSHRYSEFLKLRDDLIKFFGKASKKCPGCTNYEKVLRLFEFPPKRLFTSDNPVVIAYRKKALRAFASLLASHTFTTAPKCPTCSDYPFAAVRDFLTIDPGMPAESDRVSASSSSGDSIRESMQSIRESINVKDFTSYVPAGKIKAVNSEGMFIKDDDASKHKSSKSKSPVAAKNLDSPPAASPSSTVSSVSPLPSPSKLSVSTMEESTTGQSQALKQSTNAKSSPRMLQPHPSSADDEEFGSLNMDFMTKVSVANKE